MPYESEDEAGWNALPDVSDDEEVPVADSIGPLHTGSGPYSYRLQQQNRTLTIASQPDKGKRVLELGAGCGLVGLVFAAMGAQVLLTDLPNVLSLLEQNMLLNEAAIAAGGGSVQCCELTWGVTSVNSLAQGWATPDLVVAADVVYHRDLFDPLLSTLSSLAAGRYLLAHVRRWKSDSAFFKQLRKQFEIVDITAEIQSGAELLSSHTHGAPRLFQLNSKQQ
ncbi:MAG: Methyltransferase family [Trebouxia sp. A1-2]|nr:MAG: Methyltransferase family [Trebouxia sp. A1-2]